MTVLEDTALLITASRDLAASLAALLLSIPPLRHVERVPGPVAFMQRLSTDRQPALVVLDTDEVGPATSQVIETMRTVSPETRCLVLSNSVAESRELAADGIEPVVIKGASPSRLVDAIENLLGDSGD
ncbi:MAG TPA: hypothetical protein PK829_07125 [Promineifilum sp.]|nr:hypothetical protein [Promineifilum sp.]